MEIFNHKKKITVRYPNGKTDKVPSVLLNTLIETKMVTEFKRKDGWVVIGLDAIRGMNSGEAPRKERRH